MAQPKKKLTRARRDKRRSQIKFKLAGLVKCGHCGILRMPHEVCRNCGYYKEKEVIKMPVKNAS